MPLPSKRNPEELARTLEAWFSKQFGHACTITDVGIPEGTGMSSETLLFTLHHNGLVEPVVTRLTSFGIVLWETSLPLMKKTPKLKTLYDRSLR